MAGKFVDTAACGDVDGVAELLTTSLSKEVINAIDKDGRSALHYACLNDDVRLLRILLGDSRVDVALRSPRGDTCLHMASLYAALEAMKLLLEDGRCSLEAQNKYGETPLHLCAGSGDKAAAKAARLLLDRGASVLTRDNWKRGPLDVSRDNRESPLIDVFETYLAARPELEAKVAAASAELKEDKERESSAHDSSATRSAAKNAIFGQLGSVKLKKTSTAEKTMFLKQKPKIPPTNAAGDGRTGLSKLVDFPGDRDDITRHLANDSEIDPAGKDAYGLAAIHKFASWNKPDYLDMLLPHLSKEQLNATCPEGKTALHWAVEMASVASVKTLLKAGIDKDAKNQQGFTVQHILDNAGSSEVINRLNLALKTTPVAA